MPHSGLDDLFDDVNTTGASGRVVGADGAGCWIRPPLLGAVATQDTVIQLRAAIRKLLTAADRVDAELAGAVRTVLTRDDDYASLG